jgi:DNA-binding MarR family transcriptional regulator
MSELAKTSAMTATDLRDALIKLSESGFIEISGAPLSEVIELTPKGGEAADLLS